ncbi:hypothetical protein TVAG_379270 [Trichomonas vaginalis G3]|uniref:RRM domain-containing protein n=1 Tax=Trichomonas vaginalis (strain ATCC PRA-98 / G3) TaxID=412133 RepID=A2DBB8_TRIV3|nr:RRM1 RBM26 like domain-containing protein [Trichomonas vaginalis G3]EAY22448.1 hypothetical protein TVAG_379270 [Trichomonas vaginalis G3]KAI5517609.1 RRM1 RBM26 like domain-containing protein [Trichomonas vaginalis G3]|eukprot:XP_001583434.1 hypothetical protein [Trichomonas vaginalis G3]
MIKESQVIFIDNIPHDACNIPQLCQHFSKYGRIVGISISENKTSAQIIYNTRDEAKKVVSSTEPYANNRFVNISFHSKPFSSKADLRNFSDYKRIRTETAEVCSKIDSDLTKSVLNRLTIYKIQQSDEKTQIEKLKNEIEILYKEGLQSMTKMENAEGEEHEKLYNHILEISNQLQELEQKLSKLQETQIQIQIPK